MNEYSFIVEFDEMSENQINKVWEYLSERNIKFHVSKDDENIYIEYTKDDLINSYNVLLKENRILRENAENNDKVVDRVNWENQILKNQQKEFIEYLEQETSSFEDYTKNIERSDRCQGDYPITYYMAQYKLGEAKDILSKYKEIIGSDNK